MGFNLNSDYHYVKHSTVYSYKMVTDGVFANATPKKQTDIKTVLNMFFYQDD